MQPMILQYLPSHKFKIKNYLSAYEMKQVEADDQAIHMLIIRLPVQVYATVDSCNTT